MKPFKLIAALGFVAFISGCATTDTASRNAPYGATDGAQSAAFQALPASLNITDVTVSVPGTLTVSEANSYYPSGDIVWRGDAPGDRHAQIGAIFEDAMARGTVTMTAGAPIVLNVEVLRFHALTEKTRYTIGGVHSITFGLTLHNAETGVQLGEPRRVKANLKGFGGQRAIDADLQGQTQKVRITDHLARVIRAELAELAGPAG